MHEVLVGSTLLASFLGGTVALLAPCCVSVMLPAYFASGLARRRNLVAMTGVFALGVATVITPIAVGAGALSAAISGHHLLVWSVGGAAMMAGGLLLMSGRSMRLPMPGGRPVAGHGPAAVYGLGVFSGAASACCAPVLAGVAVLSGATGSFVASLTIGLVYVAGMVTPLAVLAVVWDRSPRAHRLLEARTVPVPGSRRRVPVGSLAGGLLLSIMGALAIVLAVTGPAMPNSGWQVTMSARLQHWAVVTTHTLRWLPGAAVAVGLVAAVAFLIRMARRHRGLNPPAAPDPSSADRRARPSEALERL